MTVVAHAGRITSVPGPLVWFTDVRAIAARSITTYARSPQLIMAATVQPVMTVLLFKYIFGGAITVPGVAYVEYLIPGVMGWTVTMGAVNTAVGLAADVKSGLVERFRALPMARSSFVTGRAAADVVRNAAVLALVIALGVAVGFRTQASFSSVVAALVLVLAFGAAISWLVALIGLNAADPEKAQASAVPPMILLVFASNAFVPTQPMPGVLRAIVDHQPLSAVLTAVRGLMLGGATAAQVIEAVLWTAGLLVVFVPLALRAYRNA